MAKEKKPHEVRAGARSKTWSFIVYPESAPESWRDILNVLHIPWVESPLHDKDMNPEKIIQGDVIEAEPKKPHYHILLIFTSNKSYEQVLEITESLNAPIPQKAISTKGLVRYMIHMDNPEKYQYDKNDIVCHGGADIEEHFKATESMEIDMLDNMIEYIIENRVFELIDFYNYVRQERRDDWFPFLKQKGGWLIGELIKSNRHKHMQKEAANNAN